MNYAKLRGLIREVFETEEKFGMAMGVSKSTISQKLSGKTQWKMGEVAEACRLLGIRIEDAHTYFFARKVEISQHQQPHN